MNERLYDLIARVLEVERGLINRDTSPLNTPTWDSFNVIMMISELEKASNTRFNTSDLMSVKNVGDIEKVLEKYKVTYEI